MCAIEIMESILGSTALVVNICGNISSLRRASIHPEAVTSLWKQADLISHLSDVYHSIVSGMQLVHFYKHQNSGMSASTLMPLASLNVKLYALAEQIMASFLLSPATRNTIAVGFLDPYRRPSVSILRVSFHSNLSQYIAYEISRCYILQ